MSPKYVGFGEAVTLFFSNYTNFKARSTRSEYWYIWLFSFLVGILITVVQYATGLKFLSLIWSLATLLPGLGLSIRRMHDIGKSGWWILINLIPIVGAIIFIVFAATASGPANQWGEPAGSDSEPAAN